ncbi:hypothetical protein V1520DRAFT_344919, partial [Lipomyces starkeyi]|uniref:Uncharacterized protein n=1 Tax=Lipomyces starkeyi NRRL Y-11557 TaxID=675824 RepID=A0A1E3QE40_LIPST|nr:hypothetical protein LIPSTDRAFT_61530 [Lipomyces starkeyi NRRL Y-11557]
MSNDPQTLWRWISPSPRPAARVSLSVIVVMSSSYDSHDPSHNAPQVLDDFVSAPEIVPQAPISSPVVTSPVFSKLPQSPDISEQPYYTGSKNNHKRAWIIAAIVALICVAVGLGAGLGVGLNKTKSNGKSNPPTNGSTTTSSESVPTTTSTYGSTATSSQPVATATSLASAYCISDSNVVKSPRFENISDWTIVNGIYHFDQISWKDGSAAGVFLPGLALSQTYGSLAYANQTISGLTANKEYSLAYAYTALTFEAVPADWQWSTYNISVAATQDIGRSSGILNLTSSADSGLNTHTTGDFVTKVFVGGNVTANYNGEIYVVLQALGFGVDLFFYYVSVYDPQENTCDYEKKPVFYYDQFNGNYVSYHTQNATIADSYCVPNSNVVSDPRFETVGSGNDTWTLENNLTYNFVPAVFSDGSPAGVNLPYVADATVQPATAGNQASLEQNFTLADSSATYRVMFSYQYVLRSANEVAGQYGFYVRLRLSNSSTFDTTLFDYSDSPLAANLSDSVQELNYRFDHYQSMNVYLKIEALSYLFDINIPRITVYSDQDFSCDAGDYFNTINGSSTAL